ncbi:hypothetical protein [Herbidospora sp. RD11066]
MVLSVYCSGSIMKGASDEKKLCWSDLERAEVSKGAAPYEIVFLNPDDPITDPSNTVGQFGRDMYQVMMSTAVIVDARERRGLGIGVEMAAAAAFGTPVIVVAPRNSKYRSDVVEYRGATVVDYIHPHVHSLAAAVVEDFIDAGEALKKQKRRDGHHRHSVPPGWLDRAITEYTTNVLPDDAPMLNALRRMGSDPRVGRR